MTPRRPRVAGWAVATMAAWAAAFPMLCAAQPTVRVQAGAHLELQGIERGAVQGRLTDDMGSPLADRIVVVDLRPLGEQAWRRASAQTSHDGTFELAAGLERGLVEVAASYSGDRLLAAARVEGRFDADLAPVRLQLLAPVLSRVDIDEASFVVRISAASRVGGAELPITIQDDTGSTLVEGKTDASGQLERALSTALLSPPGPHAVVVRSARDASRGAAQLETTVIGYLRTKVSLEAEHGDTGIVLRGALATARGPEPRKAIGLFVDGQHLATVLTDEQGRFSHAADAPPGSPSARTERRAQARFDSDAAWLASSRSETVAVRWEAAAVTPSPAWLLVSSVLCALLVLWWSARRPAGELQNVPSPVRGPGIHALGSRARGRSFDGIAGTVLDARSTLPVRAARVLLEGPDGARFELGAEDDGRFAASGLAAGRWRMTVDADGFTSQSQELTMPHHGSWAYVQVLLQSLRWAAVEAYRPAAERVLPAPHLWGQWTLREIRDSATRSGRGGGALERATALTERSAYGPEAPSLDTVRAIEDVAASVGQPHGPQPDDK